MHRHQDYLSHLCWQMWHLCWHCADGCDICADRCDICTDICHIGAYIAHTFYVCVMSAHCVKYTISAYCLKYTNIYIMLKQTLYLSHLGWQGIEPYRGILSWYKCSWCWALLYTSIACTSILDNTNTAHHISSQHSSDKVYRQYAGKQSGAFLHTMK